MNTRTIATTLAAAAALALTACTSGSTTPDDKPKTTPTVPHYKVVDENTRGYQRTITVEVDHTTNLRAVFDDVTKDLRENMGYIVLINCSTGGTDRMDNRLANGTYAVGNRGRAATGLDEGEKKFELVEGRSCPAKD